MYENVMHQGKTLKEWQILFNYSFNLGELYQMTLDNKDFYKLLVK